MSMSSWGRNVLYNHTETTANECHHTPCLTNEYIHVAAGLPKSEYASHIPPHTYLVSASWILPSFVRTTTKRWPITLEGSAVWSTRTTSVWSKEHLLRHSVTNQLSRETFSWDHSLSGTAASNATELLLFTALRFSNNSAPLCTAHLHMIDVYIVSIYCGLCSVLAVLFMLNCAVAHSSTPTQGSYSS